MARILVADDDQDLNDLVTMKLEAAGHEVLSAIDGETALSLATGERPDLIVLDWMLPRRNGPEVCREVRSDPTLAGGGFPQGLAWRSRAGLVEIAELSVDPDDDLGPRPRSAPGHGLARRVTVLTRRRQLPKFRSMGCRDGLGEIADYTVDRVVDGDGVSVVAVATLRHQEDLEDRPSG